MMPTKSSISKSVMDSETTQFTWRSSSNGSLVTTIMNIRTCKQPHFALRDQWHGRSLFCSCTWLICTPEIGNKDSFLGALKELRLVRDPMLNQILSSPWVCPKTPPSFVMAYATPRTTKPTAKSLSLVNQTSLIFW